MTPKPFSIEETTANSILDSCRQLISLVHTASRATEKELGLSAAQLYILQKICEADRPLSLNDLAQLTRTHQSSVSVVVKKLTAKNLVVSKSAKEDGRRLELRLSAKGVKLLAGSPEAVQHKLIRAIQTLSDQDGQELERLLALVLKAADAPIGKEPARMFFEDQENG